MSELVSIMSFRIENPHIVVIAELRIYKRSPFLFCEYRSLPKLILHAKNRDTISIIPFTYIIKRDTEHFRRNNRAAWNTCVFNTLLHRITVIKLIYIQYINLEGSSLENKK